MVDDDGGAYRVHISDDFATQRYRVFVIVRRGGGSYLISPTYLGLNYTELKENSSIEVNYKPLVEIPYGAAHAILGALSQVLGAVEHPLQLRQDYEAERKRVDKMTDALIEGGKLMRSER